MKIWALSVVVDTYHHIYFDRLKHWFHRGGATVVTTEIDRNSETAARRAKQTKNLAIICLLAVSPDVFFKILILRFLAQLVL